MPTTKASGNKEVNGNSELILDEQALFDVLSHPLRREILKMLAQHYLLTYSDLKTVLNQNPGVIYHHLEKLRQLELVQQRTGTKEYELTDLGWKVVQNVDLLFKNQQGLVFHQGPIVHFFSKGFLVEYVTKSASRSLVELSAVMLVLLLLLKDVPVLVIGPFLIPTTKMASFDRVLVSLAFFLIFIILFSVTSLVLGAKGKYSNPDGNRVRIVSLLAGSLLFPLISYVALLVAWLLSVAIHPLPEPLYWLLTGMLHVTYTMVALFLLIGVEKASLERAIVITMFFQYLALLASFLVVLGNLA